MASSAVQYPEAYLNYDKGPLVILVITTLHSLATLTVGLRIIVRLQRTRGSGVGLALDDWLIVAAVPFIWGEYVASYLAVTRGGIGLHVIVALETKPNALRHAFLNLYIGELLYWAGVALIKWSVLSMYYRIFPTRSMKLGYIILGSINAAWYIGCTFATIFQCTPIHDFWDKNDDPSVCVDANTFYMSTNGIPNILMDAMVLGLPLYEVCKLHLARRVKVAVGANFLIGSIVMIASIYKLTLLVHLAHLGTTADVTYYLANLIMWWMVEPSLGIIAACLPALRPVLNFLLDKLGLRSENRSQHSRSSRPGLMTFGQGNTRGKKGRGYETTASIDDDLGGRGAWSDPERGRAYATTIGAEKNIALHQLRTTQRDEDRHILVRTEVAWSESRV